MASITVQSLIDKAATLLYDQTNIKWSRAEWLYWLNMGQRAIIVIHPASTNEIEVIKLVAGPRQSIPAHGWLLLDIIRNMGTTGTTSGRAIRIVPRIVLDSYNPNWYSDTATAEVRNYTFDVQNQREFYVYPPNTGTQYIEINYSYVPDDLTNEASVISVPDAYENALLDYMLFRACSKAADINAAAALAPAYLQSFNAYMGAKMSAEQANNPNLGLVPSPTTTGGVS